MGPSESGSKKVALRVCPQCSVAFHLMEEEIMACPNCGYVFLERRGGERFRTELKLKLELLGKKKTVDILDYSKTGIRLAYAGEALQAGSEIEIDIMELDIHARARAVWSKNVSGSVVSSGFAYLATRH